MTKNILGFSIQCQSISNGMEVKVSDGLLEKKIPLLPDEGQVIRALEALEKTSIDPAITLDFFSVIVAGALMTKMKKPIGNIAGG